MFCIIKALSFFSFCGYKADKSMQYNQGKPALKLFSINYEVKFKQFLNISSFLSTNVKLFVK